MKTRTRREERLSAKCVGLLLENKELRRKLAVAEVSERLTRQSVSDLKRGIIDNIHRMIEQEFSIT